MNRSIREFGPTDIDLMINYFLQADQKYLKGMGVNPNKLPSADEWHQLLRQDLAQPLLQKKNYYVVWELNHHPVGHSNINKIIYGQEAFMHLHLWQPVHRQRGHGPFFIKASIAQYFEKFQLDKLLCEPYALNPAPNNILPKVGFELIKTYETVPGWINFHQPVNRWILTRNAWLNTQ